MMNINCNSVVVVKPVILPDCDLSGRISTASGSSSCNSSSNYDSGNYSSSNSTFDLGISVCRKHELQSEKLKSYFERVTKSEKWYKTEYRKYKRLHLETLKKYYSKKSESAQRIQRLEEELSQLEVAGQELHKLWSNVDHYRSKELKNKDVNGDGGLCAKDFEIEKQWRTIKEKQNLIYLLRKQKQNLLDELDRSSREKDERTLTLQKRNAELELEIVQLKQESETNAGGKTNMDFIKILLTQQRIKLASVEKERAGWEILSDDLAKATILANTTSEQLELKSAEIEYLNSLIRDQFAQFQSLEILHTNETNQLKDEIESLQLKITSIEQTLCDNTTQTDTSSNDDDILKLNILNRVLQTEHSKKLERYQVHIRTLLGQTGSYRKQLKRTELKCSELAETIESYDRRNIDCDNCNCAIVSNKLNKEQQILKSLFQLLEELMFKYENSRKTINVLKQQIQTDRKQLTNIDCFKRVNLSLKNNLTTLMDDYKKIIDLPITNINSNTVINDLIKRSNNFVPNFDTLTNTVNGLKDDISKLIQIDVAENQRTSSLMDELKAESLANIP